MGGDLDAFPFLVFDSCGSITSLNCTTPPLTQECYKGNYYVEAPRVPIADYKKCVPTPLWLFLLL